MGQGSPGATPPHPLHHPPPPTPPSPGETGGNQKGSGLALPPTTMLPPKLRPMPVRPRTLCGTQSDPIGNPIGNSIQNKIV